ncbi:MAG: CAP domain-containing protein [Methanoregula sp.]|nr:CAP domain-containing protein [Methanoregula sp.]
MPPRFCPTCGAPRQFLAQKFCTSCGATLPEPLSAVPSKVATGPFGIPLIALAAGAIVVLLVAGVLLLPQIMAVAGGTAAGGGGGGGGITPLPSQPGTSQPGVTAIPTTGVVATIVATPVPTSPPTTIPTTTKTPTPIPTPTTTVPTPTPRPTSVITLAVTQVPPQPPSDSYTSSTPGAPYIDPTALEARIHELTNAQRQQNGLPTLSYDPFLADIARGHSWDMVSRNFFEHENPDGQTARERGDEAGYPCIRIIGLYTYSGLSENLYQGHRASSYYTNAEGEVISYDWKTAEDIAQVTVNGWMESPGHRENILAQHLSYEGIGIAFGPDDKVYATQNFC